MRKRRNTYYGRMFWPSYQLGTLNYRKAAEELEKIEKNSLASKAKALVKPKFKLYWGYLRHVVRHAVVKGKIVLVGRPTPETPYPA